MFGHMGASKYYNNSKRFLFWPDMFDWISALTLDCLNFQNKKPKLKHRKEAPSEDLQNETMLFRTSDIDHEGHFIHQVIETFIVFGY